MIGHDDPIAIVMHLLQAGRKRATLPGTEESMTTTIEFITALFCQVDDQLAGLPKHPEAHLWPSEVVTLGLLHALKGVGNRPCSRWLTRDYRPLFPRLPERTRLFRLFTTHHRRFSRRQIGSQFHPCRAAFLKEYGWLVFCFVRAFPSQGFGTRQAYFGYSPAPSAASQRPA